MGVCANFLVSFNTIHKYFECTGKITGFTEGDMVVALIDDSATVKTFYKENGYYRLQPENDNMEPIIITGNLQILGKVFGVFRFFS